MATVEIEHELRIIPFDANTPKVLTELGQQGWQAVPGITPVVVYHLMRPKQSAPGTEATHGGNRGFGQIGIDESKVHILRNGQIIPPQDGPPSSG